MWSIVWVTAVQYSMLYRIQFAFFCALVVQRNTLFDFAGFLSHCPLSYCCPIKFALCLGHFCGSWIYNPSLILLLYTANMIGKWQKLDRIIEINITVLIRFGLFNYLFIQSIHIRICNSFTQFDSNGVKPSSSHSIICFIQSIHSSWNRQCLT